MRNLPWMAGAYPWLELFFVVPSLFEPLKFYCIVVYRIDKSGLWKYHAGLVRLVPFHSGQVENFYLLVLGQIKMLKINKSLYFIF